MEFSDSSIEETINTLYKPWSEPVTEALLALLNTRIEKKLEELIDEDYRAFGEEIIKYCQEHKYYEWLLYLGLD